MTKLIGIYNAETGEQIVREMNAEEIADYNLCLTAKANRLAKNADEEEAKVVVQTKLAALGLTTDDFKALGL